MVVYEHLAAGLCLPCYDRLVGFHSGRDYCFVDCHDHCKFPGGKSSSSKSGRIFKNRMSKNKSWCFFQALVMGYQRILRNEIFKLYQNRTPPVSKTNCFVYSSRLLRCKSLVCNPA